MRRETTHDEWKKQAEDLFGKNPLDWKFICPSCGHVASVRDWKDAGAKEGEVAFSCIGRKLGSDKEMLSGKGPCNYAGGGLIHLNPVVVDFGEKKHEVFEFFT